MATQLCDAAARNWPNASIPQLIRNVVNDNASGPPIYGTTS
jgi:hypothetical protein